MNQEGLDFRPPVTALLGTLVAALLATLVLCVPARAHESARASAGSPFDGNAMWIWQLPKANGGRWASIVRRARASNVTALFIKSADGPVNDWRQFTPEMVSYFQSKGFKVCGWHYVYGRRPAAEAKLSANAIRDGADCFIIDAEAQYEGRYASADRYMSKLRARVGDDVPIALAGFPYVDYHPSFPYSVFLRPKDGAQYNMPQMYWRAIGTSVDEVFRHTYRWNLSYGRPILPLGQLWQRPPTSEIKRFRELASAYGAPGVSWWEWTQAPARTFRATGQAVTGSLGALSEQPATIGRGSRGDWVVWAQEHLNGAGQRVAVTGNFGTQTQAAVSAFQGAKGLPVSGVLDPATWSALVAAEPVSTPWYRKARRSRKRARATAASAVPSAPGSARLPSRGDELGRVPK